MLHAQIDALQVNDAGGFVGYSEKHSWTQISGFQQLPDEAIPEAWERFQEYIAVRPGTAGLLIDIECSRVRDSSWMYLTSFVTTRIGVELAAVQRKLPA